MRVLCPQPTAEESARVQHHCQHARSRCCAAACSAVFHAVWAGQTQDICPTHPTGPFNPNSYTSEWHAATDCRQCSLYQPHPAPPQHRHGTAPAVRLKCTRQPCSPLNLQTLRRSDLQRTCRGVTAKGPASTISNAAWAGAPAPWLRLVVGWCTGRKRSRVTLQAGQARNLASAWALLTRP